MSRVGSARRPVVIVVRRRGVLFSSCGTFSRLVDRDNWRRLGRSWATCVAARVQH